MNTTAKRASPSSALSYKDPAAALDFLENAFGFERRMVITDADNNIAHAEMDFGDGYVMVGGEWTEHTASPASTGGRNTQSVHVHLSEDVDDHCARAVAAGAVVVRPPNDEFYGDRVYSAKDPEGHVWTFSQTVKEVSREEAEKASGLKIDGWV